MTGDRLVTVADIPTFVDVLLGTITAPESLRPADINADNSVDALDIQPFVDLLLQ
jgi:hypothetical protein